MRSYPANYRPQLRPSVRPGPTAEETRIMLYDAQRLVPGVVVISKQALPLLRNMNGGPTLAEIARSVGDSPGALEAITDLVRGLDDALLLQSDYFVDYVRGPHRLPSCIGCYPEQPEAIRQQLSELFTGPGGPGLPTPRTTPGSLRAVYVPHMDYARGGVTYGHAFKELVEQSNAKLFFIIATSHYSPERFTLTRKNFQTPLGVVPTDQASIDVLEQHYGPGLFDDEVAHLPEHSVELEVLLLQYLLEGKRPFRIVPLLVGSFSDCVVSRGSPAEAEDIPRMVKALQSAEAAAHEEVCYIISGDLAHIGPKFQHPKPVDEPWLVQSRAQDEKLLGCFAKADVDGFFDVIAAEQDERNICGLPPAWVALKASQPQSGKVLHYGRFVHPTGHESVSFAAAGFYRE
jgi:MEMO1 family protein